MQDANKSEGTGRISLAIWRVVQRPWVSALLWLASMAWVLALPPESRAKMGSRSAPTYIPSITYYLRTTHPDGTTSFEIVDEDASSWDRISQLQHMRPDDLMAFAMHKRPRAHGDFAITAYDLHFQTVWFGAEYPEADKSRVRDLYADSVEQSGRIDVASRIRTGTTRWTNPVGYATNALGVVLLGAFVWSLGWVRDIGHWDRNRRIRRGLCASCAYDLSASVPLSDGTRKCPECGETNLAKKAS